MAYDTYLAERIRRILTEEKTQWEEKKMMGGLCFMVDDKMCLGVEKARLMARIGPDFYEEALDIPGCVQMDFTGRPMKGYVYIQDEGIDQEDNLEFWVKKCLAFNPLAKSSKKKK